MTWLALVLLLIAAGSVVLWEHHRLRTWAPNIATSALSIAATVSVVSLMMRQDRYQPRLDFVLRAIDDIFAQLIKQIVVDYARTHDNTFEPIPQKAYKMIWLWGDSQEDIDMPRALVPGEQLPIIPKYVAFAKRLTICACATLTSLTPNS